MSDHASRRLSAFARLAACAALYLAGAGVLSGCTDLSRAIGLERTSPDEFAVESRAPLTIPPEFDLRPPQPGAPRPQEKNAAAEARQTLDRAGPGEPGKQASTTGLRYSGNAGEALDPSAQVGDNTLSSKLLGYDDKGGGVAVEKRQTAVLKGVY